MSKRAKTIIKLWFEVTTVKRLSSPERVQEFESVFKDISSDLIPTDIFLHEGRGGRRPFSMEAVKALRSWDPRCYDGLGIELQNRGPVQGGMSLRPHSGRPPQVEVNYTPHGNDIGVSFELAPLVKRGLFENALRLFWNMIEYLDACYARASIAAVSTATYSDEDNPDDDKPCPVEWNGVLIDPAIGSGGGPPVYCLPRLESWINVLGREYVELLGKDKLLALDVHRKHEDSAGRVWLQITERPEQMYLPVIRDHVKRLMDSLNAHDVFCREPRTPEERKLGVKGYRRPNFDWSGVEWEQPAVDTDPFSTRETGTRWVLGKHRIQVSLGFSRQLMHKVDLMNVLATLLKQVFKAKCATDPFGVALVQDGELKSISIRDPEQWKPQEKAELIAERLARMRAQYAIKATGACLFGKGDVPGLGHESAAYKIHLESASGDAFVVYLPFEETNSKRQYGTLVVEPGERVVFA